MTDNWLFPALTLLPVLLGSFWLVGIPWALLVLPREDWRDRVMVGALGLALGAMILTTGMFLLGTFALITLPGTLLFGAVVTAVGAGLAWRRARHDAPVDDLATSGVLARWEWLILIGLILALLLRFFQAAFWPFTAYDALWVYGYNARVFTLTQQIPADMGYYPQLIPLTYTYAQVIWGAVNDHAARAALPIFAAGSMAAAYLLGTRLASRRAGFLTLAFWVFYPDHAIWSRSGDLEVPVTFFFTMASLFFLLAWREDSARRWRYAVAAGLMLAGGMWTKPTMGAFVLGVLAVGLLAAVCRTAALRRIDWLWLRDRLLLIVVVGLASAPIGGMWYLRNLLLGLPPLVMPPTYWLTLAQRSGAQLIWPLLGAILLAVYLLREPAERRPDWRLLVPSALLLVGGAIPSSGLATEGVTHRLAPLELAVMGAGAALYALALWRWYRALSAEEQQQMRRDPSLGTGALIIGLVLPYWVTWFYSYSYHPRLAFAIVPLQFYILVRLTLAVAPRLAELLPARHRMRAACAALLLLIVPGLWFVVGGTVLKSLDHPLTNDNYKHLASNYALTRIVNRLNEEIATRPVPVKIVAPGNLRLPFFFPEMDINTDAVTDLTVLDDGVTHFIDGMEAGVSYDAIGQGVNPVRGIMGMRAWSTPLATEWDADFTYDLYRVNTSRRHEPVTTIAYLAEPALYDGFVEVQGWTITGHEFEPGQRHILNIYMHVLGQVARDYTIYLHVTDGENLIATWDHEPGGGKYVTHLWEPDTYLEEQFWVSLDDDVPPATYYLVMGFYDYDTGERLPVRVGDEVSDGFVLLDRITKLPVPAE